jgi:hypothetical protein
LATAPRRKRRRRPKPSWERGYRSHGLWDGNRKLGTVRLAADRDPLARYAWQAGTHAGFAATLREAKRVVEQIVLVGASQLPLFPAGGDEAADTR